MNEIQDWCRGEGLKLWSTEERRYVPELQIPGPAKGRLVSVALMNQSNAHVDVSDAGGA